MKLSLDGRTALVGGATNGIGWAIASALAQAGARVILVARSAERLAQRLSELNKMTSEVHDAIMANYDNPNSVTTIAEHLDAKGLDPDIIINNSGGPAPAPLDQATRDDFHRALDRLILTTHELLGVLLPEMKKRRWGRIVNVISTSVRQPIDGLGVSNTIRAATAGWAKTLSNELAPYGITVNSILPGATRTERLEEIIVRRAVAEGVDPDVIRRRMLTEIPIGRFAEPWEIAALTVFLCSDTASYITGECIRIDGGRSRCL
ncbi:MAG: SDR family oxidoreductase [Chlorobi bacterium]|nr:SDR family oxidoreductase [Chlorobiota bacterium]